MAFDAHKNFAVSTVATAPSPATSGTSLVVASGDGALFPAVPFNAIIWPVSSQPTSANAEIVRVTAISTDTFTITRAQESSSARTIGTGDQIAAGITAKTLTDVEQSSVKPFCGDGSDGDVTISSGTTTLSRDMFYNNLTVSSGATLKTNNYRVHVKSTLTNNGTIHNNGTSATDQFAVSYAGADSATLKHGVISGGGSSTNSGAIGNVQDGIGGAGGKGGNGGTGTGGNGQGVSAPAANYGGWRALPMAVLGALIGSNASDSGSLRFLGPGGVGNGGGGDGTNSGGAGGSAGGLMILTALIVVNNGTISANGGNGATRSTGNVGGGGGGGGGAVIVNCGSYTGSDPTATGGTHGNGVGTGVNGVDGSAGTVLKNVFA